MVSRNYEQRKVTLAEPDRSRRPHPMASELTEQEFRKTSADRQENHAAEATAGPRHVTRAQKKAGQRLLAYGLFILGLAVIVTMIVLGTWNWGFFILGLVILFCYMMLITAPFWLASTTKAAQDEVAKDVIERDPHQAKRAPERSSGTSH